MSMGAAHSRARPLSIRRNVNRKILAFSLLIGVTATVLAAVVYIALLYPFLLRSQEVHRHIFNEISCASDRCDTHVFTTDWRAGTADYIIDTKTRFFIDIPAPTVESPGSFGPLDYSDTGFIAQFRHPDWYETPDGEIWRLYSRKAKIDKQEFEIMVGFAKTAPWKMVDTLKPEIQLVDKTLEDETNKLEASLPAAKVPRGTGVDGYEVVDPTTQKVLDWGPWLPAFLPSKIAFPRPGARVYLDKGELYIVQTDTDGWLIATTLTQVGSGVELSIIVIATLVTSSVIAYGLSRRFLRGYFALMNVRVPTLDEALRAGEGQTIEFKRALSDDPARTRNAEDELLKSIAAFANTNDGVIFIGVDDGGRITGLDLDFKQRDRLEQKIRQLARTRMKPIAPIQVGFEDARGLLVAKITVARGDATAYMISGVIYVRDGSADVQAQPEDLKRLIADYAY